MVYCALRTLRQEADLSNPIFQKNLEMIENLWVCGDIGPPRQVGWQFSALSSHQQDLVFP
jgi:hypothetical protein